MAFVDFCVRVVSNLGFALVFVGAHQLVTWSTEESKLVFTDLTLEASIAVQLMARPKTPASPSPPLTDAGAGAGDVGGVGKLPASTAVAIPSAKGDAAGAAATNESYAPRDPARGGGSSASGSSVAESLAGSESFGSAGDSSSNSNNGGIFGLRTRAGSHPEQQQTPRSSTAASRGKSAKQSPLSSTALGTPSSTKMSVRQTLAPALQQQQLHGAGSSPSITSPGNGTAASTSSSTAGRPQTLAQEFRNARGRSHPGIHSIKFDEANRTCELDIRIGQVSGGLKTPPRTGAGAGSAQTEQLRMQLRITFPSLYPISAPPSFHFDNGSKTPQSKLQNRVKVDLCNLADALVAENKSCLLPCVELLVRWVRSRHICTLRAAR